MGLNLGKYFKFVGVATNVAMDLMAKLADGIFTVPEMMDSMENAAKLAVPGIEDSDFARFGAITSRAEFESYIFQEGDVLITIPAELADKLKIEFE